MTRVINFFAGPSAGKTTNGLLLSGMLKRDRKDVLYVPEFATELVVAERIPELDDQLYILGEQNHRLYNAKDRFEWVITDGPLLHSLVYLERNWKKYDRESGLWQTARDLIVGLHEQYDNVNFFVDRRHRTFRHLGRVHNEEESKELDTTVKDMLEEQSVDYVTVTSAEDAYQCLVEYENYSPV